MTDFSERVSGIGALAEPVRRRLYLYVCAQAHAVSRDEAAEALDIPLHKAKFHLDKLESQGLLTTEFARLSGKSGPGAGRPAKLYRRSDREISVSLPGREYELAGQLMAKAIAAASASDTPAMQALNQAAAESGRTMGESLLLDSVGPKSKKKALELAMRVLREHGYEPHEVNGRVELANCPFHSLSRTHTDMVCGMNLALIDAMVDTMGHDGLECHLDPGDGRCCVVLTSNHPD